MAIESSKLIIRRAKPSDVPRLASLAGELGYPTTTAEMKIRLRRVKPAANNAIFVAEDGSDVIAWIPSAFPYCSKFPYAPRSMDCGQRSLPKQRRWSGDLLVAAERWARTKKV